MTLFCLTSSGAQLNKLWHMAAGYGTEEEILHSFDPAQRSYNPARNVFRSRAELDEWHGPETEPVLEPELPIIDCHHHLFERTPDGYRLDDFMNDLASGHNIVGSVFIEGSTAYRTQGPPHLRPVGETEFVLQTLQSEAGQKNPGICAGLVACADLTLGDQVQEILEAQIEAGHGRMRGIRHQMRWDAAGIGLSGSSDPPHIACDPKFRNGLARLAPLGLTFDAWVFHPQLGELENLARDFPDTVFIVNHIGGPLGTGPYAPFKADVFRQWRHSISRLATLPNVVMKLGGCGMLYFGFEFFRSRIPPASRDLAKAWRPMLIHCIETFGVERCMFESNFPVDRQTCSYRVLWNAFKRITASFSSSEKAFLFASTASRIYRLRREY